MTDIRDKYSMRFNWYSNKFNVPIVQSNDKIVEKKENSVTNMFLVERRRIRKNMVRVMKKDLIAPSKRQFLKSKKSKSPTKKPFCCLNSTVFWFMLALSNMITCSCSLKKSLILLYNSEILALLVEDENEVACSYSIAFM